MERDLSLNFLEKVIDLITKLELENELHLHVYIFLKDKYIELKDAVLRDSENLPELVFWSKYFAPRIVFESVANSDLLDFIEELNTYL